MIVIENGSFSIFDINMYISNVILSVKKLVFVFKFIVLLIILWMKFIIYFIKFWVFLGWIESVFVVKIVINKIIIFVIVIIRMFVRLKVRFRNLIVLYL